MAKQYLDKEGLEIVAEKVNEAREVGAGAMALAQEVSETSTIAFTGTFAEWNALSASEKAKFAGHIVNITDDTSDVQNAVRNPDWSRAVVVSSLPYTMLEDGVIVGCVRADSANIDVYINNKAIATTAVTKMAQFQCDVGRNDIISVGGTPTAIDIRFIPYSTSIVTTEPMNYSTEEQFTGKYWIDGKKIYRKCWDLTLTSYSDSGSRRVHTSDVLETGVTFISAIGGMYAALQNNSGTLVHTYWFPITNIVASTSMTENCNAGCGVSPSGDLTVSVTSVTGLDWQEAYAKVWIEYAK